MIKNFAKRWLDIPPVWLLLAMFSVWIQGRFLPLGPGFSGRVPPGLIWILWGCAGGLTLAAVLQMRKFRTTVHPHENATHLVTKGVFGLSRNPIYVSDVLLLLGVVAWVGSWGSFAIVALFIWVLQHRFIRGEELRLMSQFPDEWADYSKRTRRWM
ncbi:methyltransferase [Tritonibacter litoralis]|uniref:methyltransferase n=1 Tax=Tritonibacter litoralis TaxID=2662264 RepID=UPI00188526F5